jgi:vancomycin resistance protein VanW
MRYREMKPIQRSKLRLLLGKEYFTFKRYVGWYFGRRTFAKNISKELKPNLIFAHSTPTLRKLKDVDMQLQHNKVTNLKLATKNINGIIIKPGETFSYWKLIGKPTYKKGYLDGVVLCANGSFTSGVGGGLCQLSNLIYWMTLHTPLTVVERYRHSHDVFPDVERTQPFGTGATCAYNYLDLQIYNGTKGDFQLLVEVKGDKLVGQWRGSEPCRYKYEVYESEHSITPGFFGGYMRNNIIFRRVYNLYDELIDDEFVTENHAYMTYSPFLNSGAEI